MPPPPAPEKVPLIHITDLYHPPYDPDDLVDLVTAYALPELDIRAVLLDHQRDSRDMTMYEPGFLPVVQLNWLTARAVPVAAGPGRPMASPADQGRDYPRQEQAAISLLLSALADSPAGVNITVVSSVRILACAYNRQPDLFREKVGRIRLVAGAAHYAPGAKTEINVRWDPAAFARIMRSGLPVDWYPCVATMPASAADQHPEYRDNACAWTIPHALLHRDLDRRLHAWLMFGFTGTQRGDIIRALHEDWIQGGVWWSLVKQAPRPMWSTAALVHGAGRVLALTDAGWRFLPAAAAAGREREPLELKPARVEVDEQGRTEWEFAPESPVRIFCRQNGPRHEQAMGEALNALLAALGI